MKNPPTSRLPFVVVELRNSEFHLITWARSEKDCDHHITPDNRRFIWTRDEYSLWLDTILGIDLDAASQVATTKVAPPQVAPKTEAIAPKPRRGRPPKRRLGVKL